MAKLHKITQSLNSGELDPKVDARTDQVKYGAGCKTMENCFPLISGGAEARAGLEYIAAAKSSVAADKSLLVDFEHSVDDTYVLEMANQAIRFFKNGARVIDGVGTEDISSLDNVVAHYLLNDNSDSTIVLDDDGNTYPGISTANTSILHDDGKVGTGSFDFDATYTVGIADAAAFSFTDNADDSAFSIAGWVNVTDKDGIQVIMSKWKEDTAKEWRLSLNSENKLQLHLSDDTNSLTSSMVAQYLLNDDLATTAVLDVSTNYDGVLTPNNTEDVSATGKINKAFDLAGTDVAEINDAAAFSFGNGTVDSPFSIASWVYVTSFPAFQQAILSKWDSSTAREYMFAVNTFGKLQLRFTDESTNAIIGAEGDGVLTDGWHFVVSTYTGQSTTGSTAANLIKLYVDGDLVTSTKTNNASYDAMEDTTTKAVLGGSYVSSSLVNFWQNKIDNTILFDVELTAGNILSLYNGGDGTESLGVTEVFNISDAALSLGWHFVCSTYSAPGDSTTAADGIILYVDGVAVASTAVNDVDYTAMQGTAIKTRIGAQISSSAALQNIWNDKIDEISLFSDVLTPTEVASLYSTTPFEITSPYLTADLFQLKFEHSADVTFITHPDYESRRLSRLGDALWTLEEAGIATGPFRDQNTDTSKTITASATTGTVTLTAIGHSPFVTGTIAGHEPSGSLSTSKSITGALFKLVHSSATPSIVQNLNSTTLNAATSTLSVSKGVTWDFVTNGTWGTGGPSSIVLERSYDAGSNYETVHTVVSLANKNIATSGTEDVGDALYRARVSDGTGTGTANIHISIRDTDIIGIVEITSVSSSTVAIGTVVKTLGSTDATHRWSEGSFSNYRSWPIDVTISSEERLTFTGSVSEPLTTWGSEAGDFTNFAEGTDDADPIQFTLVGSGQQNRIRWVVSKDVLVMGTVGGEHLLGASKDDEALTPTNVRARLQTTYGSEDIAAKLVNQAIIFVQRGGKKIREFLYNFEDDAHKADDLTVFASHITGAGITSMAFQRTPDPILWCVRTDGELALLSYERDQQVFSWCRVFTNTNLAGVYTKSVIESAAVIYGGTRSEDEVWVSVLRQIDGADSRTIERFTPRLLPDSQSDYKFLDSYITDTGGDTTIEVPHLVGQTVQILGDGLYQGTKVVSAGGVVTADAAAAKYQVGIGYDSTIVPMDIDLEGTGLSTTKRINKCKVKYYNTIGGKIGRDADHLEDIPTGTTLVSGFKDIKISGGYSRDTDITVKQTSPLPMTILSLTYDIGASND